MPPVELSVEVAREAVDWVSMIFAANGFRGETVVVDATEPPPDTPADAPAWDCTVLVRVPERDFDRAKLTRLDDALDALRRARLVGDLYIEQSAHPLPPAPAAVQRIGQRFVILAGDQDASTAPDDLVLRLAPNQAFGTGFHPATQVSLVLLERQNVAGRYALDLGSGSGILSVALARMGARVLALDNDPLAVDATQTTVALNALHDRVTVAAGSLGSGAGLGHWMGWANAVDAPGVDAEAVFDLIIANMLSRAHVALAGEYWRALKPGGTVITAGYTDERVGEIELRFADEGFEPADRVERGEWVALAHRRPAP